MPFHFMDAGNRTDAKALDRLIDEFHRQGRPRVWSLAVTIFGDAISRRGGSAPLSLLQQIMTRLRIEPGALRTAMSRLAAEGWVSRSKTGRFSHYRFEGAGRHAFEEATRKIYAAEAPQWDGQWIIAVAGPSVDAARLQKLPENGFHSMGSGCFLKPLETQEADDPMDLEGMLVLNATSSTAIPEWVSSLWPLEECAIAYRKLERSLRQMEKICDGEVVLDGIDAMAARTLLVHSWRRVVLRDPWLPAELLPANWPGDATRRLVARLYRQLWPASEKWLDEAGAAQVCDAKSPARRFGNPE